MSTTHEVYPTERRPWFWLAAVAVIGPLLFAILRVFPLLDYTIQSPAGHFWIVSIPVVIAIGLAIFTIRVALIRRDGRALLIGYSFLILSLIFFIHAIGTPGVLFDATIVATAWSTPLALLACAIILAASTSETLAKQQWLVHRWPLLLVGSLLLWFIYAMFMLWFVPSRSIVAVAEAPAITQPTANSSGDEGYDAYEGSYSATPKEIDQANKTAPQPAASPPPAASAAPPTLQQRLLTFSSRWFPIVTLLTISLYGWTAFRYGLRWWKKPTRPLAALTIGALLLAQAAVSAQYGILWHLSFWLYHVLLFAAIVILTYSAIIGYERSGSLSSAVEGLLLGSTLERQQDAFQRGMKMLLSALEQGNPDDLSPLRHELSQQFGLAEDQLDLLEESVAVMASEREESRRLQTLADIGRHATLDLPTTTLIERSLALLVNTTNARVAAVGLVENDQIVFQPSHQYIEGQPATTALIAAWDRLPLEWLRSTDVPYTEAIPHELAALQTAKAPATVLLPLTHRTEVIGVLAFQAAVDETINERFESVLQSIASQLSTAITNAQLYHDLQREHKRAVESEHTKEQLTQMIVHDLKNPLTAIISYLELLERNGISSHQHDLVQGAKRSSRTMLGLVTDLLDSARLQEGLMELRQVGIRGVDLIEQSVAELRPWAEQEGQILTIDVADPTWMIMIDSGLLTRVLVNLVSNAIKHTRFDTRITVGGAVRDDAVELWVTDTGPGIAPDLVATLFDRFSSTQASTSKQRNTGLGLHFCKLAVEAHGGTLSVDSTIGKGTAFTIKLPLTCLVVEPELTALRFAEPPR